MWDTIKDYMNSFIAILILGIPLIYEAIKSKRPKWLIISYFGGCIALIFLGIDKVGRDNNKDHQTENKRLSDSTTIHSLTAKFDTLTYFYRRDSATFSDFKEKLQNKHAGDTLIIPKIYKTTINKADNVNFY